MDSDDVREDKDDEKEKEKPMMANMNEGYEYIAYDDTGCQEGIKEKKAPSPLLDFGEDCEVESQKLQDDRIGGEKDDAIKTEKDESASSSSEDEAENVKENGEIPGDVASDSDSEGEERSLGRKASSCYSSSEEEGKSNNNEDSEEEEEVINKKETQDGLNESLIKKDDDDGQSSEDEVEKEVSVEKENVSQDAAAGVAVDAEVVQEVDFEAKYQRFLQNEEMEEKEEKREENEDDMNADEADFCLMTDKPQEVLNAVPTLEVVAVSLNDRPI